MLQSFGGQWHLFQLPESMNYENYNTLLQAFKENHEETNNLASSNNRLKGLNNWLENKINSLEEKTANC